MKVPNNKEVAIHIVPESCATYREIRREALTGVHIGQPLSRDRNLILGADAVHLAEGNTTKRVTASVWSTRRGQRPWHVCTLLVREPGGLQCDRWHPKGAAARTGEARSRSR